MHLYVVRHGETWANVEQRYLGALDPELTVLGRQQAEALGGRLPEALDVIIVSPKLRARETAMILNEERGLPVEIMDCFRERSVGVFEGLTQAEARERYQGLWARNITRQWDAAPDGGESIHEIVARVRGGLSELASRYPTNNILLVAHGVVAKVIRALSKGDFSDFYDWKLSNGSMLALENFSMTVSDTDALGISLPQS
ncbi:histidine phosphatase family protein [Salinicola sp. CR57]|uniref:histidine phosphatase family protein n=1 Tax=Salinicola sp. CR57 TaxID=1949086 RepID=UPI000DA151DC|nr:histidine phosphatase family protein [Salinicola sp. CR57]